MKSLLYATAVFYFLVAGSLDIINGNYKEGGIAILLGMVNYLIFFVR